MIANERLRPGTIIKLWESEDIRSKKPKKNEEYGVLKQYYVVKQYPHFTLLVNDYGIHKGITNADLMLMGILTQKN